MRKAPDDRDREERACIAFPIRLPSATSRCERWSLPAREHRQVAEERERRVEEQQTSNGRARTTGQPASRCSPDQSWRIGTTARRERRARTSCRGNTRYGRNVPTSRASDAERDEATDKYGTAAGRVAEHAATAAPRTTWASPVHVVEEVQRVRDADDRRLRLSVSRHSLGPPSCTPPFSTPAAALGDELRLRRTRRGVSDQPHDEQQRTRRSPPALTGEPLREHHRHDDRGRDGDAARRDGAPCGGSGDDSDDRRTDGAGDRRATRVRSSAAGRAHGQRQRARQAVEKSGLASRDASNSQALACHRSPKVGATSSVRGLRPVRGARRAAPPRVRRAIARSRLVSPWRLNEKTVGSPQP